MLDLELRLHAECRTLLDDKGLLLEGLQSTRRLEVDDDVGAALDFESERVDDAFAGVVGVGDVLALAETKGGLPLVQRFILLVWRASCQHLWWLRHEELKLESPTQVLVLVERLLLTNLEALGLLCVEIVVVVGHVCWVRVYGVFESRESPALLASLDFASLRWGIHTAQRVRKSGARTTLQQNLTTPFDLQSLLVLHHAAPYMVFFCWLCSADAIRRGFHMFTLCMVLVSKWIAIALEPWICYCAFIVIKSTSALCKSPIPPKLQEEPSKMHCTSELQDQLSGRGAAQLLDRLVCFTMWDARTI